MNHTEQRKRLRAVLAGSKCLSPASVYDPLSARVAEAVGYEIGMLAGSAAANTTLAAPDLIVLTLTEFADQIRRILLQGHQPVAAAVKALRETYAHLYDGGAPADLKSRVASPQEMERLVAGGTYRKWQREYLR
jgi:2-methylisocitrate lyase-like PEP mutase family enzyme